MSSYKDYSLQDKLLKELNLLPGRLSRYFFLLSSMDKKSAAVINELTTLQNNYLSSKSNSEIGSREYKGEMDPEYHQIISYYKAHRELLSDKIELEKTAIEWIQKAKMYLMLYNNEIDLHKLSLENIYDPNLANFYFKQSSYSPRTDSDRRSSHKYNETSPRYDSSFSSTHNQHKKRRQSSFSNFSSHLPATDDISCSHDNDSLPLLSPLSSEINEVFDRISISKQNDRKNDDISQNHVKSNMSQSSNNTSLFLTSPEGLIIKLGSQKGRPRKSTNKQRFDNNKKSFSHHRIQKNSKFIIDQGIINDEYVCPICLKSENENPSMVACDSCDRWYHCACVDFIDDAHAAEKTFVCSMCKTSKLTLNHSEKNLN